MFETVKRLVRLQDRPEILFECRHCGESLDGPTETCDCGGGAGVARYRIH